MPAKGTIIIYCDGACSGNQFYNNIGGWGAVLQYGDKVKEIYGGEINTTNQRMELTACIKALEQIRHAGYEIHIYTDSAYLVNCMQKKWYVKWLENGWKNSLKNPIENRDLWEKLLSLISNHSVKFFKVSGHSGNQLNERADALARKGIKQVKSNF